MAKASFAAAKEAYWHLQIAHEHGRFDGPDIIAFRRLIDVWGGGDRSPLPDCHPESGPERARL
jgi:hypothetical protein